MDIKTGKLPSDLTPDGFIRNEIFAKNNVPTETSDVWVTASICAESKLLANSFCPTKVNGVFLNKTLSYEKALDAGLYLPASTCKIHGGLPTNAGTELIGICTDPRHEGILYLANYPQEGELGGCPQEFIEFRSFQPGMVPSDYCKLPEHQVLRGASGDNHDENDQDKDDDE